MQLYLDKYLLATVFLIDYGETVDRINVATNVRKLDNYFLKEPGGAFQVVLSGLSPITMVINHLSFQQNICCIFRTWTGV